MSPLRILLPRGVQPLRELSGHNLQHPSQRAGRCRTLHHPHHSYNSIHALHLYVTPLRHCLTSAWLLGPRRQYSWPSKAS